VNGRISRENLNMDVKTIVSNTDMVLSHLKSRRASEETIEAAKTIASLQSKRVSLIQERDDFLNQRKEASAMVGKLMRDKDNADPEEVEKQLWKIKCR
jgi:seryl-tRNA synthetase